jgi:hypothetical protein
MCSARTGYGPEAFEFICSLVPFWRVSDDVARLSNDEYLGGIGVLRKNGDVLVVPIDRDRDSGRTDLLRYFVDNDRSADYFGTRIVVLYNDTSETTVPEFVGEVMTLTVIPWSRRGELAALLEWESTWESLKRR